MKICQLNNNSKFEITNIATNEKKILKGYKMTINSNHFVIWARNFWSLGFVIAEYPKTNFNVIQIS